MKRFKCNREMTEYDANLHTTSFFCVNLQRIRTCVPTSILLTVQIRVASSVV